MSELKKERTNGADEAFHDVGSGPWRLSRTRFSIVNDGHKWTLKFYDGNPYKIHDHAQIQENCERLCWTLNHIAHLEAVIGQLETDVRRTSNPIEHADYFTPMLVEKDETIAALQAQLDRSMRRQETLAKHVNDGLLEIRKLKDQLADMQKTSEDLRTAHTVLQAAYAEQSTQLAALLTMQQTLRTVLTDAGKQVEQAWVRTLKQALGMRPV